MEIVTMIIAPKNLSCADAPERKIAWADFNKINLFALGMNIESMC